MTNILSNLAFNNIAPCKGKQKKVNHYHSYKTIFQRRPRCLTSKEINTETRHYYYEELWIDWKNPNLPGDNTPFRFTGKEIDQETGLYYYGARYLDPKTSRWLSGDPAVGEYIPTPGKEDNNLPNGGVYNHVNLHTYHYSNNNPVKYKDPDGRFPGSHSGYMPGSGERAYSFQYSKYSSDKSLDLLSRVKMGSPGIPSHGPCYMMSLIGIAQTVAKKNFEEGPLLEFISTLTTGDNPVVLVNEENNYLVSDKRLGASVIESALKILDPDSSYNVTIAQKGDENYQNIKNNASASLRDVGGHWQEGKKNGNFRWDPYWGIKPEKTLALETRYVKIIRTEE